MATTVGKLRIILTANAGRFQKTMKRAQKRVAVFSKSATRFALKIGGIGAAISSLVAGGSLAVLVRDAFRTNDALAKTADKLGIATEALAGMRLAAELSGVDIRKMQMGLQRMTRRVSEAAKDTGEAKDAIKELGLDAKRLNTLSPDKMMLEFSKALESVALQGDRVRLGFKLWDSEGVDLINMTSILSKEWDKLTGTTKHFGTAISRIDAAQLESVNDSFRLMREWIKGSATQLAVHLAPNLQMVAKALLDVANDGRTMANSMGDVYDRVTKWTIGVAAAIESVFRTLWLNIRLGFEGMLGELALKLGSWAKKLPGAKPLYEDMVRFVEEQITVTKILQARIAAREQGVADRYQQYINDLGDFTLKFKMLMRDRVKGPGGAGFPGAGAAGATIQGRRATQGLIRPGGIIGVQKLNQTDRSLGQISTNTKNTATGIEKLVQQYATGLPIHMD
jgi:hypothetical protein